MELLNDKYLTSYKEQLSVDIPSALKEMDAIELTPQTFTFYTSVAVNYKNLNQLGIFYEKIDHEKAGSFLQMLPNAINYKE